MIKPQRKIDIIDNKRRAMALLLPLARRRCMPSPSRRLGRKSWLSSSLLTPQEAGRLAAEMVASMKGSDEDAKFTTRPPSVATLLSHAGIQAGQHNAPQSPPLHTATTYTRPPDGMYRDGDSVYARNDNPTRLMLERNVYDLECINMDLRSKAPTAPAVASGADSQATCQPVSSFAFASGLMAVTSILLAHASPITVLIPDDFYHGTSTLFFDVFARHSQVKTVRVDMRRPSTIVEAIARVAQSGASPQHRNVIVWMETPSNPQIQVVDIQQICQTVQEQQKQDYIRPNVTITTVVDGTMSSPILTRPLELGADISLHSATKYLGGHSDALLGVLTASPVTDQGRALTPILKEVQVKAGGVASPWDSWLVLRGLRTLAVRVQQQCRTAMLLAEYLDAKRQEAGSMITAVHYPGLTSHPQHDVATRQMKGGYGGILSIELQDEATAMAFAGAVQLLHRATSLGGTESLIEHRASIEPPERTVSPPGLLRISVGLEDVEDLILDMDRALHVAEKVCRTTA